MKRIVQTVVTLGLMIAMVGCASSKPYFIDRARDARDILVVGVEAGSVGVSAQVGPFMTGAILTGSDAPGVGILDGRAGQYVYQDLQMPILGVKSSAAKGERGTEQTMTQYMCLGKDRMLTFLGLDKPTPYAWGTVDARVGCGVGLHVGIHFGELADFLLGWFGIDIMGDDLEAKKLKETSNQVPEDTARKLADPQH